MKFSTLRRFLSLFTALLLALSCLTLSLALAVSAEETETKTVIITLDPGHGPGNTGTNGAVEFGGVNELYYTLSIAQYCKERLEQFKGVEVHMTRTNNEDSPSLTERADMAKEWNSDAIISIHNNAATATAHGAEVIVPNNNWRPEIGQASTECGTIILDHLVEETGVTRRRVYTKDSSNGSTYEDGSVADYFTVINRGKTNGTPVVMIVETGFLTNQEEWTKLFSTEEGLKSQGYAIANGLAQYYGLSLAPTTEFIHASNDELRLLDADGNQIGEGFTPGQFDQWTDKVIEIEEGSVYSLVDWGWAAFKSEGYQYAYIVNGEEYADESFAVEAEQPVLDAIAALNAPNGSRFMGVLPTEKLNLGENTVQFIVKLDEDVTEVIREYKVVVTEKVTEPPTEPPTEEPTETPTEAPSETVTEAPTEEVTAPAGGCSGTVGFTTLGLVSLIGAALAIRKKERTL